jgi:hypothetical protein
MKNTVSGEHEPNHVVPPGAINGLFAERRGVTRSEAHQQQKESSVSSRVYPPLSYTPGTSKNSAIWLHLEFGFFYRNSINILKLFWKIHFYFRKSHNNRRIFLQKCI